MQSVVSVSLNKFPNVSASDVKVCAGKIPSELLLRNMVICVRKGGIYGIFPATPAR